jgi:hypothetical protein
MRNLWPFLLFNWNIVMWAMAPRMNRTRNTAVIGTSVETLGVPPNDQVVGAYGGPDGGGMA